MEFLPPITKRCPFHNGSADRIQGVDYFKVCADEIRTLGVERPQGGSRESMTLITESGYLMLVG